MNTLLNTLNPRWVLSAAGGLLLAAVICLIAGWLPALALALLGFELLLIVGLVLLTTPGAASNARPETASSKPPAQPERAEHDQSY